MVKTKNIITSLLMLVFWVSPVKSQDIKLWGTELQNAVFEQVTILLVGNVQDETHYKLGLEHRGINNPLDIILLANSISKDLGFTNVTYSLLLKGQVIFESSVDQNRVSSKNLSENFTNDFNKSFYINKYRFNAFFHLKLRSGLGIMKIRCNPRLMLF